VTNEQDWEVDEPALSKKFDDDNFYTYYAFREMENGEAYVHSSVVDEMKAEALTERLVISNTLNEIIDKKNAHIAKLEAALKFYAEGRHIEPADEDDGDSDEEIIEGDGMISGRRAREALED
jgi:hypothetical protein